MGAGTLRRRPDGTRQGPSLHLARGSGVAYGLIDVPAGSGCLRPQPRARAHPREQPEHFSDEHPCLHTVFPMTHCALSTLATSFDESFFARLTNGPRPVPPGMFATPPASCIARLFSVVPPAPAQGAQISASALLLTRVATRKEKCHGCENSVRLARTEKQPGPPSRCCETAYLLRSSRASASRRSLSACAPNGASAATASSASRRSIRRAASIPTTAG